MHYNATKKAVRKTKATMRKVAQVVGYKGKTGTRIKPTMALLKAVQRWITTQM
jgi:hypothetical protein